jgi:hypothetical protein
MPSSYSTDLKLELMVTGEQAGLWGDITNTNLNLLQQAIAGYQAVSIAGGAQTTALAMTNATISNARNAVIELTGVITGNQVVTIPDSIEKTYIIYNNTSGAFTVQFKTVSGTGVTFGTTDKSTKVLYSNGTNIVDTLIDTTNGVNTLTNKTLTSPIINQINDANSNEEIIFTSTASAVNELTIANAATGNAPSIATSGSDSNISLTIAPKGTGDVNIDADTVRIGDSNTDAVLTTNGTGDLTLSTNSGTNSGTIKIFDAANGNIELTPNGTGVVKLDGLSYPTADGSANQALVTNGSGVLSFSSVSSDFVKLSTSTITANTASVSFDGYFTSDYDTYIIFGNAVEHDASSRLNIRLRKANADITSGHYNSVAYGFTSTGYGNDVSVAGGTAFIATDHTIGTNYRTGFQTIIYRPLTTYYHHIKNTSSYYGSAGNVQWIELSGMLNNNTTALSGITYFPSTGNFDSGTIVLYGVKK